MKNILVLAHDDPGQSARLRVAIGLARALDGRLTCLDVSLVAPLLSDYVSGQGMIITIEDEQASETLNSVTVRRMLEHEAVAFDWRDVTGDPATCLSDAARLADLIVANRALDAWMMPDMLHLVGKLLVRTDLPVLAVPQGLDGLDAGGHMLIAWDGSASAEAAMRAALPILKLASRVTLLHVRDGSLDVSIERAAAYLGWYGIAAHVLDEQPLMDRPGAVLLAAAINEHADLVVMGGFGRAPWIEKRLGGTSQRMLSECPVPILMAHRD